MSARKKVVLVDDQITNLTVGRNVLAEIYEVFTVPSGDKLFKLLEKIEPGLILLDVEMPGMNGYEVIKKLKGNEETIGIPVIFLTAKSDMGSELEGLSLGAVDYISKPFSPPLLKKRIEAHLLMSEQKRTLERYNNNLEEMVSEKTRTILELQDVILETIAELLDCRDNITGGHIIRTSRYLKILADLLKETGLYADKTSAWDTHLLALSARLHDVGKISISDAILHKPGDYTPAEYEEMKKHTLYGAKVLENVQKKTHEQDFLNYARIFAVSHHERWDGTGYPYGLRGDEIPLEGRLMAVADVYDALVSERPYKKPFSHEEAVEIITDGSGTQFEPALVDLFLNAADKFAEIDRENKQKSTV